MGNIQMRNSKEAKNMKRRIRRHLDRQLKSLTRFLVKLTDPRHQSWVQIPLVDVLRACLFGLIANCRTPRNVEDLLRDMRPVHDGVPSVSDSTMCSVARRMEPADVRNVLVGQIVDLHRSKALAPASLPISVATIDGKNLATTSHDALGWGQPHHDKKTKKVTHHLVRAVRAGLTSAVGKPCLDQMPIPADTNDMGVCRDFVDQLVATYGHLGLFELFDFDAGFCSKANADHVHGLDYAYVFSLKDNNPDLLAEARRLLEPRLRGTPDAASRERRDGSVIHRRLVRTTDIAGFHDWSHLRQAWLVRQETYNAQGRVTKTEDRYYLSNLPRNRLNAVHLLTLVRNHWGIENDVFNSLDVQWEEDAGVWCTKGHAVYVLGLLRLIAYNFVQHLRRRHLPPRHVRKHPELLAWRDLFVRIRSALTASFAELDLLAAAGV